MSDDASWMQPEHVDTSVSRSAYRYSVPHAVSDGRSNVSPGVAVSIEEKVSDLIESYPHLKTLLKSHSKDGDARLRDLAMSSQERDQLLLQIIAARRQQQRASGATGPGLQTARGPQVRLGIQHHRRKKPAPEWLKGLPKSSALGNVTGKWHKRLWG
jgi:ribosomal protein S15P/S13E